jgi:hypothetical protein
MCTLSKLEVVLIAAGMFLLVVIIPAVIPRAPTTAQLIERAVAASEERQKEFFCNAIISTGLVDRCRLLKGGK